jgi:magnesium transporter
MSVAGGGEIRAATQVPIAAPEDRAAATRAGLLGHRYDYAGHIAVIENGRCLGLVPLEALLAAGSEVRVRELIDPGSVFLTEGTALDASANRAAADERHVAAVVDHEGAFVGLLPPASLLSALRGSHETDLALLGGFSHRAALARAHVRDGVATRFRHRVPWLLFGLLAAVQAAMFVSRHEHELSLHLSLAFFLPAIVYLADAVGTQTEAVAVRALSLGSTLRQIAYGEVLSGVAAGALLACLIGPLVGWLWHDARLALCVALSTFASCSVAAVSGLALPWLVDSLSLDPAYGSGPLATVVQDLLSIVIYFTIAGVIFA